MKFSSSFLFVLTAACALGAAVPTVVSAQTSAAAFTPTVISTAPYTISKPGYYVLGADLSYAGKANVDHDAIITIAASNVTLDFVGHTISGPAASNPASRLNGVFILNRGFVTVLNGTIANCSTGVQIAHGSINGIALNVHNRLSNLSITHCLFEGINLDQTTANEVSDCRISFIGGSTTDGGYAAGIDISEGYASRAVNNTVTNVTGTANVFGIVAGASDLYATGNNVSNLTAGSAANGSYSAGFYDVAFAIGNVVNNAQYGFYYDQPGKYKDNLTRNCVTPFGGTTGVDAGGNN